MFVSNTEFPKEECDREEITFPSVVESKRSKGNNTFNPIEDILLWNTVLLYIFPQ